MIRTHFNNFIGARNLFREDIFIQKHPK